MGSIPINSIKWVIYIDFFFIVIIFLFNYLYMIQKNSIIKNGDNSGISFIRCIDIVGKNRISKVFNLIKFSIKKLSKFKKRRQVKVQKGKVYDGLILTINVFLKRLNGFFIKFDNIKSIGFLSNKILGSRIYCNSLKELNNLFFINKKNSDLIRKIVFKSKFLI